MFATFIAPQYILSQTFTHPGGVTGKVLCKLLTGGNFAWVGAASSVFTLVNISMERYYAVMYPLSNKGNLSECKLMVSDVLRKSHFTIVSDGLSSITLFHKISGIKTGSFTFSC